MKKRAIAYAELLRRLRIFFEERNYLEVFTNSLVEAGAFESSIDPLRVSFKGGNAELHTSPEMEMKKVLAELRRPIFQIARCFRDDPPSPIHFREFTMLEFYCPSTGYRDMQILMKELLEVATQRRLPAGTLSVQELFLEHAGIDLTKAETVNSLAGAVSARGLAVSPKDSWNDLFFKAMLDLVEPRLPRDQITFVVDFPLSTSPLSKRIGNTAFAERFEVYWKGMELCNGCTELTDPQELLRRAKDEGRSRIAEGKTPHPLPASFVLAAENLPPCAGVAVGIDRLLMCLE